GMISTLYQHTDALGSPVVVTNQSRTVVKRNEYEPYGKLVGDQIEDGPGYTGHMGDSATQLIYMQQRYYDPTIDGRFPSVDPVTPLSPGGTFNRYWYANASPYRFFDPDGRASDEPGRQHRDMRSMTSRVGISAGLVQGAAPSTDTEAHVTGGVSGSGWTRPANHPYVVGREGTSVEPGPGDTRGKYLDDNVPGFHTMGTWHDKLVEAATDAGFPDSAVNIQSMGPAYGLAVAAETMNTNVTIINKIFEAFGAPIQFRLPFEHTHQQTLRQQLASEEE